MIIVYLVCLVITFFVGIIIGINIYKQYLELFYDTREKTIEKFEMDLLL